MNENKKMEAFDKITFEFSTFEEVFGGQQSIEASASGGLVDIVKFVATAGANIIESKPFADMIKYIVSAVKSADPKVAIEAFDAFAEMLRKLLTNKETVERVEINVKRAIAYVKARIRRNEILVIKDGQVTKESLRAKIEGDMKEASALFGKSADAVVKWLDKRDQKSVLEALENFETLLTKVTYSGTEIATAIVVPNDKSALQITESIKDGFAMLFNIWFFVKEDVSKGLSYAINTFLDRIVGILKNIKPGDILAFAKNPSKEALHAVEQPQKLEKETPQKLEKEITPVKELPKPSKTAPIESDTNDTTIEVGFEGLIKKLDVFGVFSKDIKKVVKEKGFTERLQKALGDFRRATAFLVSNSEIGMEIEESLDGTIQKFLGGDGGKALDLQVLKVRKLVTSRTGTKKDEEIARELFGEKGNKMLTKLNKIDGKTIINGLAKLETGYLKFASKGIKLMLDFVPGWGWLASFVVGIVMEGYIIVGPFLNKVVRLAIYTLAKDIFAFLHNQMGRMRSIVSRLKVRNTNKTKDRDREDQQIQTVLNRELENHKSHSTLEDTISTCFIGVLSFERILQSEVKIVDSVILDIQSRNQRLLDEAARLSEVLNSATNAEYLRLCNELALIYVTLNDMTKMKSLHHRMFVKLTNESNETTSKK